MTETPTHCGYVAILGAPNAGKSTLVNALVGTKVSIVSPKVQTTRTRVLGISVQDGVQTILVDTPGIFKPSEKNRMEKAIVAAAWEGAQQVDLVAVIVDASRRDLAETFSILEKITSPKTILVLNKIDKINPQDLLALAQNLNEKFSFDATFMVSAEKGSGVSDLLKKMGKYMPSGPFLFPEDQVTDMPMRLLAAEITREKLFAVLHQELPYGLTVETENWEPFDNGSLKIDQAIIIAREAHKKIILGKGGAMIKKIGEASRHELENILEQRVHLKLFVKVREDWMDRAEHYQLWGLDPQA